MHAKTHTRQQGAASWEAEGGQEGGREGGREGGGGEGLGRNIEEYIFVEVLATVLTGGRAPLSLRLVALSTSLTRAYPHMFSKIPPSKLSGLS